MSLTHGHLPCANTPLQTGGQSPPPTHILAMHAPSPESSDSSSVKYFVGPHLPCIGYPTLALTYEEATKPTIYSEAFVFIDGLTTDTFLLQRWKGTHRDIRHLGDPQVVMEHAAMQWARAATDDVLFRAQNGPGILMPDWTWKPTEGMPILGFWLRNKFTNEISGPCRQTKCSAFQSHIKTCSPSLKGVFGQGPVD